MTMPTLNNEQRSAALEKAWAVRSERAKVREKIKKGKLSVSDLFDNIDDPIIARMKVVHMIESLPGHGKVKAERIMEQIDIAPGKRMGGLGKNQRDELIARFG